MINVKEIIQNLLMSKDERIKKILTDKNFTSKNIDLLIKNQKQQISWQNGQLNIFKKREFGGELWGGSMSGRNGTNDLRLVKPPVLTKRKVKYAFSNSVTAINNEIKQREHNIKLLERLKNIKFNKKKEI